MGCLSALIKPQYRRVVYEIIYTLWGMGIEVVNPPSDSIEFVMNKNERDGGFI